MLIHLTKMLYHDVEFMSFISSSYDCLASNVYPNLNYQVIAGVFLVDNNSL